MNYDLQLLPEAIEDLAYWKRSGQKKVLKKIVALLEVLKVHPQTGTGKPEALKGDFAGLWSRRIDKGARLIYSIYEETVCVYVLSMRGHYGDK